MNTLKYKRKVLSLAGRNSSNGKLSFVISYLHNRYRFPNLRNPKDLSEIWIKRVLDGKVNELSYLADKYENDKAQLTGYVRSAVSSLRNAGLLNE